MTSIKFLHCSSNCRKKTLPSSGARFMKQAVAGSGGASAAAIATNNFTDSSLTAW